MIHALGFSQTDFDAADPGRLCRGRERWIEPFDLEVDSFPLHRLVISGAEFSDDSARDALRGIQHSGVELATLIATLFPRRDLLAFMEDGHPADIPEGAEGVEAYAAYRSGGRTQEAVVRWTHDIHGVRDLRLVLGDDPEAERARGFIVLSGTETEEELAALHDILFLLSGMSALDSPPARFQPSALPDVLALVKAVILLHRDKHGPALGVYSLEPVRFDKRLETLCDKSDTLLVQFAIPPMLARWDRALAELRTSWLASRDDEFPVPPAQEPSGWEPRRRRRRRGREEDGADAATAVEAQGGDAEEE